MKRKRQISKEISYKENDNTGLKQQSLSGNQTIDQRNIQPSVAICSVFKRIFDDLDLRPISKYNNVREGQNINTPKTPTCKRRCVLGVDLVSNQNQNTPLQRSCLTSLSYKSSAENKTLHKCLQRRKKIPVLRDITNFSETHFSEVDNAQEGMCTRTPKTPSYKRRRVLGVSLDSNQSTKTTEQRSCFTVLSCKNVYVSKSKQMLKIRGQQRQNTTHVPNKRKQRQNKISVGYDIPNIDQLHDDHIEDDPEEMNDCDVDIEGIIEEIDADLEFDVSSQETTDSENDDLSLDAQEYTYSFFYFMLWARSSCAAPSKRTTRRKVERSVKKGVGPDIPPDGNSAKFGQLYIADTENEVKNRANCLSKSSMSVKVKKADTLKEEIIEVLMKMLNEVNPYVKQFRSARERFDTNPEDAFHMRIISDRLTDGRTYNAPMASEVAALIPGDFNLDMDKRDIVLQQHSGKLMRINEIHASYLALQYPLLFTYGEDGFRLGIKKGVTEATKKQKKATISMRQFFAYRLHERKNESGHLLHARRLFQQFLVDAYTTIESNRLRYLKLNQSSLRSDSFDSIKESENAGRTNMNEQGTEFVLPASFTGGPRYMKNNYLDAMTICKHFGFPDLFITFTCNPKCPELTRFLKTRNLKPEDRPEVICRIFKMKLESLMDDLTKKHILGKTVSCELMFIYLIYLTFHTY
ncbi:BnaCnng27760D [Brassica napus]|uniref:BnaCnng27760D protein n=1 Tax=Brassica napus TaxID=3708 RepID=A0A078IXN9_BRANA|nr:BnaCnng27760D [Brassica napus]